MSDSFLKYVFPDGTTPEIEPICRQFKDENSGLVKDFAYKRFKIDYGSKLPNNLRRRINAVDLNIQYAKIDCGETNIEIRRAEEYDEIEICFHGENPPLAAALEQILSAGGGKPAATG